ncbi:Methionine adenosyltransferase 2 subunit beta [Gryllus bimaculatus]|nr:Methionine adenosyltransferase 2 subunit beta [Gryllus bimaculatus]
MERKLYLTGASGLLGRAVRTKFAEEGWTVYGTALNRISPVLHRVDLNDNIAVEKSLSSFKPNYIIHCAAERFPDRVQADPNKAEQLNVGATKNLVELADKLSVPVLYISTDYVFNGKSPPFKVNDIPSPVNLYGELKLRGEEATLETSSRNAVLRIPVLYGPVEKLSESAVTVLLENLLNASQPQEVSNYEKRRPSHYKV